MNDYALSKDQDTAHDTRPPSPAPLDTVQMMRAAARSRRAQSLDVIQHRAARSDRAVQRAGGGGDPGAIQETAARGVAGSGGSLPHLDRIQSAFGGHDVSGVKAHVGGPAAEASSAMGAEAYATGNDVAFQASPDLHTAAHEAAHVVQQRAGVSLKGGVGQAGDRYEQHADAVADRVVQGRSAEDLLDAGAGGTGGGRGVQRKEEGGGEKKEDEKEPWWKLTPEVSLKPPLLTGFNEGPEAKLTIDPSGAVSGSVVLEGKHSKEVGTSAEFGNPPFLGKVMVSGEVGVKAKGGLKLTGSVVKHEDDPDKDYIDLVLGPTGTVEFFGNGKLAGGPAFGVPDLGNASIMAYGQLEGKMEAGVDIAGGVRWNKDGLNGVLTMGVKLAADIKASGGLTVVVEFLSKDVELAELKMFEVTVAEAGVEAKPSVTLPGGAVTGGEPKITEPRFIFGAPTKVTRLKNHLAPAIAKARAQAEKKIAEMEAKKKAADAAYEAAKAARAEELGVSELRPDQEYSPLPPEHDPNGPQYSEQPDPVCE